MSSSALGEASPRLNNGLADEVKTEKDKAKKKKKKAKTKKKKKAPGSSKDGRKSDEISACTAVEDTVSSESESPERRKKIKGKKDKSMDGESGIEEGEGHKKIKKKKANKGLAKILASPNPSKSPKNSPRTPTKTPRTPKTPKTPHSPSAQNSDTQCVPHLGTANGDIGHEKEEKRKEKKQDNKDGNNNSPVKSESGKEVLMPNTSQQCLGSLLPGQVESKQSEEQISNSYVQPSANNSNPAASSVWLSSKSSNKESETVCKLGVRRVGFGRQGNFPDDVFDFADSPDNIIWMDEDEFERKGELPAGLSRMRAPSTRSLASKKNKYESMPPLSRSASLAAAAAEELMNRRSSGALMSSIGASLSASTGGFPLPKSTLRIKAANKFKLIEKLICEDSDPKLVDEFLLYYNAFMTHLDILELLIILFNKPEPVEEKTGENAKTAQQVQVAGLRRLYRRTRVAMVMQRWIELHRLDFLSDHELSGELRGWMKEELSRTDEVPDKATVTVFLAVKELELALSDPPPLHFECKQDPDGVPDSLFASLDPDIVAEQLTLLEYNLMTFIRPREFLKQAWNKPGNEIKSPGIHRYIDWFNYRSHWFSRMVVVPELPQERAHIISLLIKVALKALQLRNYNVVMEIVSSLHSTAISRLKKSWELVSDKEQASLAKFSKLMSPDSNYHEYREALKNSEVPFVPYLGVFLTDFTFLDDSNPDHMRDGMINWVKARMVGTRIKDFLRFKEGTYSIVPDGQIRSYLVSGQHWGENELFQVSSLREARDGSNLSSQPLYGYRAIGKRFNHVKLTGREVLSTERVTLDERDWQLLYTGATINSYKQGEVIAQADVPNFTIYRIKSGYVKVESPHGHKMIGPMTTFGPSSILHKQGYLGDNYVASSETVEIYEIAIEFAFKLFNSNHGLFERFYGNLAYELAAELDEQLRNRDAPFLMVSAKKDPDQEGEVKEETGRGSMEIKEEKEIGVGTGVKPASSSNSGGSIIQRAGTSSQPRKRSLTGIPVTPRTASLRKLSVAQEASKDTHEEMDSKYCRKFGLQGQVIIKDFTCRYKQGVIAHLGHLYIFPSCMGFYSAVFGHTIKEVFEYREIISIEKQTNKSELIIKFTSRKKESKKGFLMRSPEESMEAHDILETVWQQYKQNEGYKKTHNPLQRGASFSFRGTTGSRRSKLENKAGLEEANAIFESNTLTKQDWDFILKGAKVVHCQKNQVILQEGEEFQRIYQISSGGCRLEKRKVCPDGSNISTVLGRMGEEETFGETSFLMSGQASATVIADENETSLYVIEGYFVRILFDMKPDLAGKFYRFLAQVLLSFLLRMRTSLSNSNSKQHDDDKGKGRAPSENGAETMTGGRDGEGDSLS